MLGQCCPPQLRSSFPPACKELPNLLGHLLGYRNALERDLAPSSDGLLAPVQPGSNTGHIQELPAPVRENARRFWLQSLVLFQLEF